MRALGGLVIALFALTAAGLGQTWKPLWDGKSFDGWHIAGKGEWTIEDRAILGEHAKDEKEFGHLVKKGSAECPDFRRRSISTATSADSTRPMAGRGW